jgi:hypothetical protein
MLPIPAPTTGGSIGELRPFLNVRKEDDFVLVVAWLLAALRDKGPYPVEVVVGEQGSAKTTFCTILKMLVDPNTAPLRALSREDRELFIAANNGYALAFDNVSGLATWISDTLCRLSTGGGNAVRALFTDTDEVLFSAQRPIILNGIEDFVTRPDLADRAMFKTLSPIPRSERKTEKAVLAQFKQAQPRILGALLDAVVVGLGNIETVVLDELPRMADFALWITACEPALWEKGTFAKAYELNMVELVETVIEADHVALTARDYMGSMDRDMVVDTASGLLVTLSGLAGEAITKNKDARWPGSAKALSGRLGRAATNLRKIGIDVSFGRESDHSRKRPQKSNGSAVDAKPDAKYPVDVCVRPCVRHNPLKNKVVDDVDASDAKNPHFSGDDLTPEQVEAAMAWERHQTAAADLDIPDFLRRSRRD